MKSSFDSQLYRPFTELQKQQLNSMGNTECCDDRNKGGDWGGSASKIDNKSLQRINTKDVNKSLDKAKGTKETINTNRDLNSNSPGKEEHQKSVSLLKGMDKSNSNENWAIVSKKQQQNQPKDKSNNLSFSKSQEKPQQSKNQILSTVPQLNPYVSKTFYLQGFFKQVQPSTPITREYGGEIYEGQINNNMPNGFGKFYKNDQSLYIGYFSNGKAHGDGAFIFADGSYYKGKFQNNKAEDQDGCFKSAQLQYKGGFRNNTFHGKGQEKGFNHSFRGQYSNGQKVYGSMTWNQNDQAFVYEGTFNQDGQFHGQGTLRQPTGVFTGDFSNGVKHGFGKYKYTNSLRYEGEYVNNQRCGKGKLINPNQRIAYEGSFQKGLPHGQGLVYDKDGNSHPSVWLMGIDQDSL